MMTITKKSSSRRFLERLWLIVNGYSQSPGFTLIELIIVVALVGVLALVVGSLFLGHEKIYHTQRMELGVTSDARTALDDIDVYVRMADVLVAAYGGYTLGTQTLIVKIPAINASGLIVPAAFDHVVYTRNGSTLDRILTADAASSRESGTKRVASRVSALTFAYDNPNPNLVQYVTTTLTTQETYAGVSAKSITLSSKSKLRNN